MKIRWDFLLPEDTEEHDYLLRARYYMTELWDLDNEIRSYLKHGPTTAEKSAEMLGEVRAVLFKLLNEPD